MNLNVFSVSVTMKICECGNIIPRSIVVDNKRRNLKNRTKCLICVPFGSSQFRKKTPEEYRSRKAREARNRYHRLKEENDGVDRIKIFREQRKNSVIAALGGKCQLCCYDKLTRNLAFHHLHDKEFPLDSRAFQRSWNKIIPEILKCVLVCHNCHGEIHAGIIDRLIVETMNSKIKDLLKDFEAWAGSSVVRAGDLKRVDYRETDN